MSIAASLRGLSTSFDTYRHTRTIVCLFREPDAGNPPVRFDEREQETEPRQTGLRRRCESFRQQPPGD
jgi:hypothetical protein